MKYFGFKLAVNSCGGGNRDLEIRNKYATFKHKFNTCTVL